eukprot:Skav202807  [mRNA]  locus=scaffold326:975371:978207:+ [translate_table: standard]
MDAPGLGLVVSHGFLGSRDPGANHTDGLQAATESATARAALTRPGAPRAPAGAPKSVAIIGGGVAGLACAKRLRSHGVNATVFDTGKREPGGRASSRLWRLGALGGQGVAQAGGPGGS